MTFDYLTHTLKHGKYKQSHPRELLKVGDCVALGLRDGGCEVGLVGLTMQEGVRLDKHYPAGQTAWVPYHTIVAVRHASPTSRRALHAACDDERWGCYGFCEGSSRHAVCDIRWSCSYQCFDSVVLEEFRTEWKTDESFGAYVARVYPELGQVHLGLPADAMRRALEHQRTVFDRLHSAYIRRGWDVDPYGRNADAEVAQ